MKPTKKAAGIEQLLTEISGDSRPQAIQENRCLFSPLGCGRPILGFEDYASEMEYTISGLCQHCQDKFYGEEEY